MESQKIKVISTPSQTENFAHDNTKSVKSSSSSFWSYSFNLSTFPFFVLGCPFYLLTIKASSSTNKNTTPIIYSTKVWLTQIFSCSLIVTILSVFLLIPTFLMNAYVIYEFGRIFNNLFIFAKYTEYLAWDIIYFARYIPIVVPLDYIWLRGYKIRNMIQEWDDLHEKYFGWAVAPIKVRLKVILMILAIYLVHVIRIFTYLQIEIENLGDDNFWEKFVCVLEYILDLCLCLLIPLYCTFCYAIKFQLLMVKALVYKWIHDRIVPNIDHLNLVKQLYTQAADNIAAVNGIFSLFMSVALTMIIIDTVDESDNLWKGALKVFGGGGVMAIIGLLVQSTTNSHNEMPEGDEVNTDKVKGLTPEEIRVINADVASIVIIYALIFFMVRQAVNSNDTAREINVWLNDFVTGGSGTNLLGVLKELGVQVSDDKNDGVANLEDQDKKPAPIWARTRTLEDGRDDEFLKKFQMLKSYIHVRMQTEKPALLAIALVGFLVPSLSGRLRRYQVLF